MTYWWIIPLIIGMWSISNWEEGPIWSVAAFVNGGWFGIEVCKAILVLKAG